MSRGLGGHSMGGYGTIRIGMKRPDVFSSLYIMSACCLMNQPFPAGNRGAGARGAEGARGAGARSGPAPSEQSESRGARGAAPDGARGAGRGGRGGGFGNVQAALAAAFSPNPKNPPDFFDNPTKDGEPQPLVIAKWAASSPLAMLDQYVTNLKKYHAITGEVGLQDGLAAANKQMDQILTDFGVTHTFETYEGDHTNRVVERIEQKVLPFFSTQLSFREKIRTGCDDHTEARSAGVVSWLSGASIPYRWRFKYSPLREMPSILAVSSIRSPHFLRAYWSIARSRCRVAAVIG
jgi:hypothetical protein